MNKTLLIISIGVVISTVIIVIWLIENKHLLPKFNAEQEFKQQFEKHQPKEAKMKPTQTIKQ